MSTLVDIQKKIAELQARASEIKAQEFTEKLAIIKETMGAYGITVQDLQDKSIKTPKVAGTKSVNLASAVTSTEIQGISPPRHPVYF